tara:strand:+ start:50 stop:241 length:192 start_codon:yes stop_codon:yes gene_type:complete
MSYSKGLEQNYLSEIVDRMEINMEEVLIELSDSVIVTADGCNVEPDGKCYHGYSSPLLLLGLI